MSSKIVVVTGSNKGLGRGIVEALLRSSPTPSLIVYLCSRDAARGQKTLDELLMLKGREETHQVRVGELDVTDLKSVEGFKARIEKEHGKLDVLVGNAGVAISGSHFDISVVKDAFATNYWGNKNVTEAFLPLLKKADSPRIVNMASTAGLSSLIKKDDLQYKFTKKDLTVKELEGAIGEFETAVANGTWEKEGWPSSGYGMSKLSLTALTKIYARENPEVLINSCCPGYVATDMAPKGHKTIEQGVSTPVQLAIGDIKGVTGEFWRDGKVAPW